MVLEIVDRSTLRAVLMENVWQPPSNLEEPQVAGDDSAGAPFVVKRDMGELRGSDEELPVVIYPPHEYVGPAEHGVSDTEASATEEQQQSQNDAQGSI
ncbi:hypothetical protein KEM52_004111 [Ascosphaera acerosa]|nr:hypothetical protein KEM52_004111 [Ascosphaera acerosa]